MAKIIKMAASILAVMLLLLTARAPSTARQYAAQGAQLLVFSTRYFILTAAVLTQTAFGFSLVRSAASAPTLASRRLHTVAAVACFVNLACKLYMVLLVSRGCGGESCSMHAPKED
ncbi:uncharacterized protein LOC106865862 [Brachypodium distachyon]|uniref:CASP-like protein n=1 Tax=Brachypodium distachyon TaxID=15368 RepID=A0A2K2DKN4_BRADI|nr:uncharacterized protein LOC106865862 [Brachypodium distachyon]PNT74833.1 hypothetical protein BRADI_1g22868v3 [Brachypodium distachyon]|eukprot:XP_014752610.1 uncharacterized protein LOC106865862 [Brachypodium distachyon]